MSEMIERVAHAIQDTFDKFADPSPAQMAIAAIEEMLVPTMAMELAAQASDQRPSTIWGTMIKEALK